MKVRRLGMLALSAALMFSLFTPAVQATTEVVESAKQVSDSSKEGRDGTSISEGQEFDTDVLIERIHELFPGKFDFLEEKDFRMDRHRYFRSPEEEDIERHSISFNTEVDGERIHGNFTFVGEDLDLESFSYRPGKVADAYFPPKVNKKEAQKIAEEFMGRVAPDHTYQLRENNHFNTYGSNRTLTEPVKYEFSYERMKGDIPVRSHSIRVTVLGSGDVVNYYGSYQNTKPLELEEEINLLSTEEAITKITDHFSLKLRYQSEFDYRTRETSINLAYIPVPRLNGVRATNGEWFVNGRFTSELPEEQEISMLIDQPMDVEPEPISKDEAKALAKKLLDPQDDEVELRIQGLYETENHLGIEVYSIDYMYYTGNGGTGSRLEINKHTGEVLNFRGYREHRYPPKKEEEIEVTVSYEEALELAVASIEEFAPANMHKYSYPLTMSNTEKIQEVYQFTFPRVENGVPFMGDSISVSISSETGKLVSFNSSHRPLDEIPSANEVVELETAKKAYLEELEVELYYIKQYGTEDDDQHYLVYEARFSPRFQYFDAVAGEWRNSPRTPEYTENEEESKVTHSWAEEELNFLIEANVITVEDWEAFDPDVALTKGEALKVMMKSLTRYWDRYRDPRDEPKPTFENIDPNHELFSIVESASQMGILDRNEKTFAIDDTITRQELAYWYVRALRLDAAAKHSQVYQLDFEDADQVDQKFRGHVALASAFGILTANEGQLHPQQEVTLAQLAVTTFRLADIINNMDNTQRNYFY